MLKDDLYTIQELTHDDNIVHAGILLHPSHKIFAGHFPGQPVLPGVCMMQMVRELLETALGRKLQLLKADNIKFISLVVPATTPVLDMQLTYKSYENSIAVTAMVRGNSAVCLKFQGKYLLVNY